MIAWLFILFTLFNFSEANLNHDPVFDKHAQRLNTLLMDGRYRDAASSMDSMLTINSYALSDTEFAEHLIPLARTFLDVADYITAEKIASETMRLADGDSLIILQSRLLRSEALMNMGTLTEAFNAVEHMGTLERLDNQRAYLTGLLIFSNFMILVVVMVLYLYYNRHKDNQILNIQKEEIALQSEELRKSNAVKDRLFSIIAHDLRVPLATLKGIVFMIRDEDFSKRDLHRIADQLEVDLSQNASMIDNLLTWTKSQMDSIDVRPEIIDLAPLVDGNVRLARWQADRKSITVNRLVPSTYRVWADYDLLDLVIRNITQNAVKFTNEGGEINLMARETDRHIELDISDNGIGMTQDEVDHLFDFKHRPRRGTKNEKGSGLGLMMSKEFLERFGGFIKTESTVGEGTTFTIFIPKADPGMS
jgi:signal transduction histidine kinase